jgi:membrane-associated protease RseP (regulator of RpoE activity)
MRRLAKSALAAVLASVGVLAAGAGSARATTEAAGAPAGMPSLVLLGVVVETGQAIVWDAEKKYCVFLELDDVYREVTVIGVGADFMTVQPSSGDSVLLRLVPAGTRGAPVVRLAGDPLPPPAAIGTPAAPRDVTILPEVEVAPDASGPSPLAAPASPAVPPPPAIPAVPAIPAPPAAPAYAPPAPPPAPALAYAPPAPPPALAAPPAPPPPPAPAVHVAKPSVPPAPPAAAADTLSMTAVRTEVSAMIAGDRRYWAESAPGGGFRLHEVAGSPLERAGVREGDVIVSINGTRLASATDAMKAYATMYTVSAADIVLVRAGAPVTLHYRLVP